MKKSTWFLIILSFTRINAQEPSVDNKYALITGVSRGIGRAIAENLMHRGIIVVGIARAPESQIQELIQNERFIYFQTDLGTPKGLTNFDEFIHSNNFTFDIIIHNAAIIDHNYLADANIQNLEKVIAINLLAPMKLAHILSDTYRPYARIACISSGAAFYPIKQLGAYCISKAGLEMLVQVLRAEYEQHNIGIVSIIPGVVDTDMQCILRENTQAETQADFQALYDQNELISPTLSAAYIASLMCDISFRRYKRKALWDIDERSIFQLLRKKSIKLRKRSVKYL